MVVDLPFWSRGPRTSIDDPQPCRAPIPRSHPSPLWGLRASVGAFPGRRGLNARRHLRPHRPKRQSQVCRCRLGCWPIGPTDRLRRTAKRRLRCRRSIGGPPQSLRRRCDHAQRRRLSRHPGQPGDRLCRPARFACRIPKSGRYLDRFHLALAESWLWPITENWFAHRWKISRNTPRSRITREEDFTSQIDSATVEQIRPCARRRQNHRQTSTHLSSDRVVGSPSSCASTSTPAWTPSAWCTRSSSTAIQEKDFIRALGVRFAVPHARRIAKTATSASPATADFLPKPVRTHGRAGEIPRRNCCEKQMAAA